MAWGRIRVLPEDDDLGFRRRYQAQRAKRVDRSDLIVIGHRFYALGYRVLSR